MQFNYAVYVFNKDIAQLRWYCGLLTRDLKPTLLNLRDLFNIKVVPVSSKHKRSLSASSQEYLASSHLSVLSRHDAETSIEVKTTKDTDLLVSPSVSPNPPKVLGSLESWDFQEPPTLSLLSPGKSTNNSEPSLSSRVEDLRIEDSKEAIEDTKVERQSSESIPTSNGDNSYPVKARTYSEPCSSDQVIEEFHDCLFMPNIDSASSPKRKDDENECEKSNSAVEESSESEAVLTKLNSIDNLFASVASRTEALANRSGSFNLVKSRASTMESS
ncbi:hypothetical protein B566_EDAN011007 [Ephemera danica]|nr:hypothetical protein B566_EDAN011007 [Ephemera danica]